ncbi:unnamed protein product [Rhizoctonia solani]|uniref:Uncharacterized protein n=1 Tax=Rhizoctonia solani AG-3 Rhs1AP TaxID=1086054 RepID=X8J1I4_9AGAM|nr:hypothetical protein RSOL_166080 [Rhizoctonia solani AG-3 Rhs1AP]CAE6422539.1 unnamed protein product [Rhizoctonia solani]
MEPQVSSSRFRRFMSRIFPKGRSRTEYTEKSETKAPLQEQRYIRLFSRKHNKELSVDESGSSSADTLSDDWEVIEDTHPRRLGSRPNNSKTRLPSSHRSQSGRRAEYYNYTLSSSSLARRDSDKENRIGRRLPS